MEGAADSRGGVSLRSSPFPGGGGGGVQAESMHIFIFKTKLQKQKKDTRDYLKARGNCQEKMEGRKRKEGGERRGRKGNH